MKTILELREEAIKEDKNPEFYLYQKLVEVIRELHRKDNIINAIKDFVKTETAQYYLSDDEKLESYGWEAQVILDKIKELENSGSDE